MKNSDMSFGKWQLENSVATYNKKSRLKLIWGNIFLCLPNLHPSKDDVSSTEGFSDILF